MRPRPFRSIFPIPNTRYEAYIPPGHHNIGFVTFPKHDRFGRGKPMGPVSRVRGICPGASWGPAHHPAPDRQMVVSRGRAMFPVWDRLAGEWSVLTIDFSVSERV